jgi:hypothetical protein
MPDRNTLRNALIHEGLSSYLDAMTAIDEFTRIIQEDCRAVLERQAKTLADATGLKFSIKEITDYSEPYKGRQKLWSGQYSWIGTLLPILDSDKFYSMDVGLIWNYEDGETSTRFYSCFYTKQLSLLDELDSKLRRTSNADLEVDKTDWALILWGENAVGSDGQYRLDCLERIVSEWISVWKSAGGITKVFSNGRSKK